MAKKKKSDDAPGGANWMDTYGDMVTLLLCFFVLLFSFSTMDAKKWEALRGAFSGSSAIVIPGMDMQEVLESPFENLMLNNDRTLEDILSTQPAEDAEEGSVSLQNFSNLMTSIEGYLVSNGLGADLLGDYDSFTITIRLEDSILFESGSANLLDDAYPVLNHMAAIFSELDPLIEMIRVEGHTDNRPIRTSLYKDNWDLASQRATNTVRYILESGAVDTKKIYAASFGEEHNVADNGTPEGQAKNRRVDFVIESIRGISQQGEQ